MGRLFLGCGIKLGFAAHPISRGGFPVFFRVFTRSPAVGREMGVKAFRIRIASLDRQKIFSHIFERGDDKRRAFGSPVTRLVRATWGDSVGTYRGRRFPLKIPFTLYIFILIYILILIKVRP